MTIYKGQIPIAGLTSPIAPTKSMGQIVESKIPLVDAGLHLLDGTLVRGDGVYKAFVDKMADLYTLDPTAEYFCTQENWEDSVFNYGVCEKFVYDSTYNTVRLPKMYSNIRYLIKSYDDGTNWYRIYSDGWCEQGGIIPANQTSVSLLKSYLDTNYSVLMVGANYGGSDQTLGTSSRTTSNFVVSTSSYQRFWQACGYTDISEYKKSPNYLYIVLATASKTEIEVDIDEIITDLNGKADTDLLNVPSSKGILTESYVNGSSWYRVYSDGWCEQGGESTTNTVTLLKNYTNTNYNVQISFRGSTNTTPYFAAISVDTKSGSSFTYGYDTSVTRVWQACGYVDLNS